MNIGTETNSLINSMMANTSTAPEVGMGATELHWTDRDACTIIAFDGKIITTQRDFAERIDERGMSDAQEYEYSRNPKGAKSYFKFHKKSGNWREVFKKENGRWVFSGSGTLSIGHRSAYYNFSF